MNDSFLSTELNVEYTHRDGPVASSIWSQHGVMSRIHGRSIVEQGWVSTQLLYALRKLLLDDNVLLLRGHLWSTWI